ncbi:MAG: DEAD/DEAH box helicase family protein, partial [Pseudomonadota bacterium]|nr:DEAD/DEAH box helicase family protein [Pseudomonadota bacterium]
MDKVLTHYAKTYKKAVYNVSMPVLVKIVFDIPINDSFEYISDDKKVKIGSRVRVSFGNTTRIGIVIDIIEADVKSKTYEIKKIDELIDEVPVLTQEMFKTCKWVSSYYHHPIGQVIFSAMTPLHRKQRKEPVSKLEIQQNESFEKLVLNAEQKKVYDSLVEDKKKFKVNVIRGVTGSGKTELYVKLAKRSIEENHQILVMVPEINLIPQTLERFKKYLKNIPLQYHSNLTPIQKHKVWKACYRGEKIIVIGTRS